MTLGLDRPLRPEDWSVVLEVIQSIQAPNPLSPDWKRELGDGWPIKATHAKRTLFQAQLDLEPVPNDVWAIIDPQARAAFLRNTVVGCLNTWSRI